LSLRIKQLHCLLKQNSLDALLVTQDENITYLTKFPASESWLLVTPKKSFYITDFRYILEAKKGLKGVTIARHTGNMGAAVFELTKAMKSKRIGFDGQNLSYAAYQRLKKACPKSQKLIEANGLVESLREVKDKDEIRQIKAALKIHEQAFRYLQKIVKPGFTERDILLKLEQFVKARDAGFSFDTIIASGANSCYPHARVTNRRICRNDLVLIDMGVDLNGYKSDLTRMFFLGKISNLVKKVNEQVWESQRRAIAKIAPGVAVAEVDYAARNYLETQNLAKYFGHALGHGVGLEIHENPRISQKSPAILQEGMIITVEPAVYLPGKFGIRIEDMVLVTKKGCEVVSERIY